MTMKIHEAALSELPSSCLGWFVVGDVHNTWTRPGHVHPTTLASLLPLFPQPAFRHRSSPHVAYSN